MDNVSFGEKAYSAAKISAVLDALVAEGVSPVGAFGDADVSLDDLHLPSTRISKNQLIQCYRNAAALSRDPHLPYTIGSSVHLSAYGMYGYAMLCSTDFRRTMEFAVRYHPGHVRKLLKQLGYSVQRPTTRLVQADPAQKNKWVRYTYPNLKKKPGAKGAASWDALKIVARGDLNRRLGRPRVIIGGPSLHRLRVGC